MNNFLKNSSVFFIFVLMLTNLYALKIESITSNASEKGVLGIGEKIYFEIKLDEEIDFVIISPKEYNGGKLKWEAVDKKTFSATYIVEEGQSDQKDPLQLKEVKVCKADSEYCSRPVSGDDISKTIDATTPKFKTIINKINEKNQRNYTIEASLENPEDLVNIKYRIIDQESKSVEGALKLEASTRIIITDLDLSSLTDGKITIEIEATDAAENKFEFKEDTLKITKAPVLLKVNLATINSLNQNNYSFEIEATGYLEGAKVIGSLQNTTTNEKIEFESTISKKVSNVYKMDTGVNTSTLSDGTIELKIAIIDAVGNRNIDPETGEPNLINIRPIYRTTKDATAPVLILEKETIYSNISKIIIKGTVTDKRSETISATYELNGSKYDCVRVISNSATGSITRITCEVDFKDIVKEAGTYKLVITTKDIAGNSSTNKVLVNINTSEVWVHIAGGDNIIRNSNNSPKEITGKLQLSNALDANSTYFATLTKLKVLGTKRYNLNLKDDGTFVIDLTSPTSGTPQVHLLTDGTYIVRVYLRDIYGNTITKYQRIIIDSVAPIIEMNNLETTNIIPELTGKVIDDLEKEVKVTINNTTYDAIVDGDNWKVQVTDELSLGVHNVKVVAKDKAANESNTEGTVTVNLAPTTGGGIRILPAAVPTPVETPAPVEEPVEEPAPVQTPEPEENTNTGGENLTPVETPIETPQLEETPIETPSPSGLTGFAGFASSPGGVVTIVGGALVVIGAIGYFFFLRPR